MKLTTEDFRSFVLSEGYLTYQEMILDPGKIAKLMNDDQVWESFKETMEYADMVRDADTRNYLNFGY